MNDDLIARLIKGPGSRELDATIWCQFGNPKPADFSTYTMAEGYTLECLPEEDGSVKAWAVGGGTHHPWGRTASPKLTTSIDAALAFAVGLHGPDTSIHLLKWAIRMAYSAHMGQDAIEAIPRHICAEALKARTE